MRRIARLRPQYGQPERLEKGMVDPAGGTLTRTCSPHLERATVSLLPPEAVAVSWTGSGAPIAETVSVLVNAGAELLHLSRGQSDDLGQPGRVAR